MAVHYCRNAGAEIFMELFPSVMFPEFNGADTMELGRKFMVSLISLEFDFNSYMKKECRKVVVSRDANWKSNTPGC